jgi:hypothetical protein
MSNNITPPSELVQQWFDIWQGSDDDDVAFADFVAVRASQYGADQELEACCEWLVEQTLCGHQDLLPSLRAARRPKPPSLKELALEALDQADKGLNKSEWQQCSDTIRRALEQLDD